MLLWSVVCLCVCVHACVYPGKKLAWYRPVFVRKVHIIELVYLKMKLSLFWFKLTCMIFCLLEQASSNMHRSPISENIFFLLCQTYGIWLQLFKPGFVTRSTFSIINQHVIKRAFHNKQWYNRENYL